MIFLRDFKKTAAVFNGREYSYSDILKKSFSLSVGPGLKPGETGAIIAPNSMDWIFTFYSIWYRKGAVLPVDYNLGEEELAYILGDSRPAVVYTVSEFSEKISSALAVCGLEAEIVLMDEYDPDRELPSEAVELSVDNTDSLALIMYTSGTTGSPKGVMLSFENILSSVLSMQKAKILSIEETMFSMLPFYHIFPLQGAIIIPLFCGSTVIHLNSLSSEEIIATLGRYRITLFLGVPRLYNMFHNALMSRIESSLLLRAVFAGARRIGSLRIRKLIFGSIHRKFGKDIKAYLTAGAMLEKKVSDDLWTLGFKLVEGYGATETSPIITFNTFDDFKLRCAGKPLEGTEVKITEQGEVAVRGRNVMTGYLNKPEATAAVIKDGWYYTGDLGEFDEDGFLFIRGRRDDMIVLSNGKNINPEEVEKSLMQMVSGIEEAGVFAGGDRLRAVIRISGEAGDGEKDRIRLALVNRYNASAPAYRRISSVVFTDREFERTSMGKIKRFLLPGHEEAGRSGGEKGSAEKTEEFRILSDFILRLKGEEPSPEDHIELDLAFDSLDRVELISFIDANFGVTFTVQEIGEISSLGRTAEIIGERKTRSRGESTDWHSILVKNNPYSVSGGGIRFPLLRFFLRKLLSRCFRYRYRGLERLPDSPFILIGNHQSYLDAPMIASVLPPKIFRDTFYMVKKSRFLPRLIKIATAGRNIIVTDAVAGLKESLQKSAAVLKKGKNLIIFPEGHRTEDGEIAGFKKTFAILCRELDVPVVPAVIRGAYDVLPRGRIFPSRGSLELEILDPVYHDGMDYESLSMKIESIVKENFKRERASGAGDLSN